MNPIRKIKFSFYLGILLLLCGACQDWLSVSPKSEVKYDDLFKDKNGFKDQLTGIYTAMCAKETYGANVTFGAIDAVGQYYYLLMNRNCKYYYISRFEYDNTTCQNIFKEIWGKMYNAVANVNILLEGIEEHAGVLSQQEKDIYKGEALGLRAFLHFDLLRMFGKSYVAGANEPAIPYMKEISKNVISLSTVDEALGWVIADLEEAARLLERDPIHTGEETTTFLGTRIFHLNYYAVRALLARVYLYRNDKVNALKNASEVIRDHKFTWVTRGNVTTTERENRDGIFVTENIFMLNNTALNDLANEFLRPGMIDKQDNVMVVDADVRDVVFEKEQYGTYDWRNLYYFELPSWYGYNTRLWRFSDMPEGYRNRQPLIRMSEMYLIAAECTTNRTEAVEYLNTLRVHRGIPEEFDFEEEITDGVLSLEIGKEYRKEFWGDGQWFFYCKRMDKDNLPDVLVPFKKDYYCFPMPDIEIEYGNRN